MRMHQRSIGAASAGSAGSKRLTRQTSTGRLIDAEADRRSVTWLTTPGEVAGYD